VTRSLQKEIQKSSCPIGAPKNLIPHPGSDPLILSNSEEFSIKSIVQTLANLMDFSGEIIFDSSKPDGQYRKPSDTKILKVLNPKFKFMTIEEGFGRTIDWFINSYPSIRA